MTRVGRVTVRQAEMADVPAITAVTNRAFVVERFFVDGDRTSDAEVRARFERGAFLVAEDDGVAVGSVYVERRPEAVGYIGLLAVDPPHSGCGIGRLLMNAAERRLADDGATLAEITVVSLRTELFPFYARLGYRHTGDAPFEGRTATKVPCHFVVMRKAI